MAKIAKRNVNVASSNTSPAKPAKASKRKLTGIAANALPVDPVTTFEPVNAAPLAADTVASDASLALAAAIPTYSSNARDAAGIMRFATNFAVYSDRDTAYLAFFGNVCRANNGAATLRQIHETGVTRSGMPDKKRFNPNYAGSSKATDVGAINRLCKAGYFTRSPDGNTLTATPLALSSKAYLNT